MVRLVAGMAPPGVPAGAVGRAEPLWSSPPGVFPWSEDWFRGVAQSAQSLPSWLQHTVLLFSEAGLLLFAVLFLAAWWRARGKNARRMTLALLAPVVTVGAYLVSETIKAATVVVRPCRAVSEAATIADCPPLHDWSFPSNHATIAGAAAVAALLAWRALAWIALPAAVAMAVSRVAIGVHFPLDVAAGLLLGSFVALVLSVTLARALTPLVDRLRRHRMLRPLLADPSRCGRAVSAPAPDPATPVPPR